MALIRWEPASELQTFHQEFNRLFGSLFDSQAGAGRAVARRWVPAIDLVEDGEQFVLRVDLPGVSESDVKVEVEDDVLTVSGERSSEQRSQEGGYRRYERASGRFARALRLPEGIDPERVEAQFENGVLEVRIPKPEQRKPHRVEIGVAKGEPAIEAEAA
jgi:HSP20 family protein